MKPFTNNPRKMSARQAKRLKETMTEFGDLSGIVHCLDTDEIIGGNQRSNVAQLMTQKPTITETFDPPLADGTAELGYFDVGGRRFTYRAIRGWDADKRTRANLVANAGGGAWDSDLLANVDASLLQAAGFGQEMLDNARELMAANQALLESEKPPEVDAEPKIDRAEELRVKWNVESGQMWQLGEHRLICGDCTDAAVVARVMGGERFRLCFTSPPYSNQRTYEIGDFDWLALANGMSDCAFSVGGKPSDLLINLGMSYKDGACEFYWNDWISHCKDLGHPLYGWYVWDKGSGFPGEWSGRLAPSHEFVFHFSIGRVSANKWIKTTGESEKRGTSGKRFRQKDGSMNELASPDTIGQPYKVPDSVIRVGREMARGIHTQTHPAVFSIEFAAFGIRTWSDEGGIVYEPFSGSGTTIIACENLSRKCRAIEISPAYVAVALERWATATGKTPVLMSE